MLSITAALQRIKDHPHAAIEPSVAEQVCRELGLEWKNTPLSPPNTIALLARQVLAGNISNSELVRQQGLNLTPEAYCTAQGRVPPEAIKLMSQRVCQAAAGTADAQPQHRWKEHRTWHIDGSSVSMPDTPELRQNFGQPGNQKLGCGFPVAHILCLFSAITGLIVDVILSPLRTADQAVAAGVHPWLKRGDIVIADTAFGSYFHLAGLWIRGVLGLFPMHQKRIVSFRHHRRCARPGKKRRGGRRQADQGLPTSQWVRSLGPLDQLVRYLRPSQAPRWMSHEQYQQMPTSLLVREIRRTLRRPGFRNRVVVLVTTLLDPLAYPADEIVSLLGQRWTVETNLRHLKTTMKMDVLRCKTVEGVTREMWAFMLVYNLVRVIMMQAAAHQRVPLDRISFADALYWMRHARANEPMPALTVNPYRPDRCEPRAVKRRPKEYDRLNKPRAVMRRAARRKPPRKKHLAQF